MFLTRNMDVAKEYGRFTFGLERDKVVRELHNFADAIESEDVLVQSIMEVVTNKQDDYTTRRLVVTYVEKKPE